LYGTINYSQEIDYEYLNGSEFLVGIAFGEPEVFTENALDFSANPLSEQFNQPFVK
jgi:hypothetical protein